MHRRFPGERNLRRAAVMLINFGRRRQQNGGARLATHSK
jgi:hypothetical protein